MSLFDGQIEEGKTRGQKTAVDLVPLAERMRPASLDDFLGQQDIVGPGKILRSAIEKDQIPSMIFWGPPGTGKTTLVRIIANLSRSAFVQLSATSGGVKDVREIIKTAADRQKFNGQKTILFVDEIHRFNKSQQDAFLPHVEDGTIILIGATTENPSFEVNSALLSRCRVFIFQPLGSREIGKILERAINDKIRGFGNLKIEIKKETLKFLADMANSDARTALNALELAVKFGTKSSGDAIAIDEDIIKQSLQKSHLIYDRAGEEHYNIISALHKSMRGSDADASLYWLGRMLEAGEDPLYVARRLIRFASEDIGLADPGALVQAMAAYQACHYNGLPECNVNLAQAVAYLARASKSNDIYVAYQKVQYDIKNMPAEGVPLHLRNAPTALMKDIGYGEGYKYNPNFTDSVKQDYLPASLKGRKYLATKPLEARIILASSSPARAEILKRLGLKFEVAPSDFNERAVRVADTSELVRVLALAKGRKVAKQYKNSIIIAADTMIDLDGRQIGKANNAAEAEKILKFLRGRMHRIITGVAVINSATGEERNEAVEAEVTMKDYSDKKIEAYVASGEPIGKGAYCSRGLGRKMVIDKIKGEESCVEGLPISLVVKFLGDFGIKVGN